MSKENTKLQVTSTNLLAAKTPTESELLLYNGWELSREHRFGLRFGLRFSCCLQEPVLSLALNPYCTHSLQKTRRGCESGLATGYTAAHNLSGRFAAQPH